MCSRHATRSDDLLDRLPDAIDRGPIDQGPIDQGQEAGQAPENSKSSQ